MHRAPRHRWPVRRLALRPLLRVRRTTSGVALVAGLAHSAPAQSPSTPSAWGSASVGSAGDDGLGAAAEGWFNYGSLAVGVHSSSADRWYGARKREQSLLVGVTHTDHLLRVVVAGGLASSSGSRSNGEQSGTRTNLAERQTYALEASAQFLFSPYVGAHVTWFAIPRGENAYTLVTLGLVVGALR